MVKQLIKNLSKFSKYCYDRNISYSIMINQNTNMLTYYIDNNNPENMNKRFMTQLAAKELTDIIFR